jgi:hypothetical protein
VDDAAEHVVSYGGTSQYKRDGTGASACGREVDRLFYGAEWPARYSSPTGGVGSRVRRGRYPSTYPSPPRETTAICPWWSGNLYLLRLLLVAGVGIVVVVQLPRYGRSREY